MESDRNVALRLCKRPMRHSQELQKLGKKYGTGPDVCTDLLSGRLSNFGRVSASTLRAAFYQSFADYFFNLVLKWFSGTPVQTAKVLAGVPGLYRIATMDDASARRFITDNLPIAKGHVSATNLVSINRRIGTPEGISELREIAAKANVVAFASVFSSDDTALNQLSVILDRITLIRKSPGRLLFQGFFALLRALQAVIESPSTGWQKLRKLFVNFLWSFGKSTLQASWEELIRFIKRSSLLYASRTVLSGYYGWQLLLAQFLVTLGVTTVIGGAMRLKNARLRYLFIRNHPNRKLVPYHFWVNFVDHAAATGLV